MCRVPTVSSAPLPASTLRAGHHAGQLLPAESQPADQASLKIKIVNRSGQISPASTQQSALQAIPRPLLQPCGLNALGMPALPPQHVDPAAAAPHILLGDAAGEPLLVWLYFPLLHRIFVCWATKQANRRRRPGSELCAAGRPLPPSLLPCCPAAAPGCYALSAAAGCRPLNPLFSLSLSPTLLAVLAVRVCAAEGGTLCSQAQGRRPGRLSCPGGPPRCQPL